MRERLAWPVAVEFRGGGWMEAERQSRTLKLLEDLVQTNVEDWLQTSFAVFGASRSKGSHTKAATETASV